MTSVSRSVLNLDKMSPAEYAALLVFATADGWNTAYHLAHLECAWSERVSERREELWRSWLAGWAEAGLVHDESGGSEHRRISHEARFRVLSSCPAHRLKALAESHQEVYWMPRNALGPVWLHLHLGNRDLAGEMLKDAEEEDWVRLLGPAPSPEALALLGEAQQEKLLGILAERALTLEHPPPRVLFARASKALAPYRIALHAIAGDLRAAETDAEGLAAEEDTTGASHAALSLLCLASNRPAEAKQHAYLALRISKGRKKYPSLSGALGAWATLCALIGGPEERSLGESALANPKRKSPVKSPSYITLHHLLEWLASGGGAPRPKPPAKYDNRRSWNALSRFFHCVLVRWEVCERNASDGELERLAEALITCDAKWMHSEFLSLKGPAAQAGTLARLFVRKSPWERKLDTLATTVEQLVEVKQPAQTAEVERRILWLVGRRGPGFTLTALLQIRRKSGFSKGSEVPAWKLRQRRNEGWLSEQDRRVLWAIESITDYWLEGVAYHYGEDCIANLVGHPHVYWKHSREPIEVVKEVPSVSVLRRGKSIVVSVVPRVTRQGLAVIADGNRLRLYEVDENHQALCECLGEDVLEFPREAEERISELLGNFPTNVAFSSDIAPKGRQLREVAPDSRPVLFLRRSSEVLRISFCVMPLGEEGSQCTPGKGNRLKVAEIDGVSTQTKRNLKAERDGVRALLAQCPKLAESRSRRGTCAVRGVGAMLEVLHELHQMGEQVLCLWKEGEPMRVDMSADLPGLKIRFEKAKDWLSAEISVVLSEGTRVLAQDIVRKLVPGTQRFIELDTNQFVELSEALSQKLHGLSSLGRVDRTHVHIAPANAYALSAWLGDLANAQTGGKLADARLTRVRESTTLVAEVPEHFLATLRSYQQEAFDWLARLAHWGGGALLCDDMGLGKTVQMLAILAHRGPSGPALVVAPVSVIAHWVNLMKQFAPSLSAHTFASANREETVANLGPGDVLIVSYGLLHNECDVLTRRSFATIVLDEAQAIKNPRSKRARAAFKLEGEFRVVTTGTPIENNLGELWSIMNFANPGLLGTSRHFATALGKPIQKDGDQEAILLLRKILSPFLLRRTKSEVLTELPAKTEVTLEVEPGPEEAEFYSAVCDSMLEELRKGRRRPAKQRMQILAALMKLRRIACHPILGGAPASCGSAKQETFLQLVDELREAGHRILVFSQFVDHLAIAKTNLEAKSISYQYLDGSTSKKKRAAAVAAFQNGEGDVFLISLKAGGVGLHLTGADYVIHLDPWWNPAVEDQASDRAHRMGQTRPVTVYRLVTKGTVEEKVLTLHEQKRQLAEELISGSENVSSLGVDELMNLIGEAADSPQARRNRAALAKNPVRTSGQEA